MLLLAAGEEILQTGGLEPGSSCFFCELNFHAIPLRPYPIPYSLYPSDRIEWTVMDRVTTQGLVNLYPAVKAVPRAKQ